MLHVDNTENAHKMYKGGFRTYVPHGANTAYAGHIVYYGFNCKEEFEEAVKFFDEHAIFRYNEVTLHNKYGEKGQVLWTSYEGFAPYMKMFSYIRKGLEKVDWR